MKIVAFKWVTTKKKYEPKIISIKTQIVNKMQKALHSKLGERTLYRENTTDTHA